MNGIKYFAECRYIANFLKYFGLGFKVTSVYIAFSTASEFAVIIGETKLKQYESVKRVYLFHLPIALVSIFFVFAPHIK